MNFVSAKKKELLVLDHWTPFFDCYKASGQAYLVIKHGRSTVTEKVGKQSVTRDIWDFVYQIPVSEKLFNAAETDYQELCVNHMLYKLGLHLAAKAIGVPDLDPNKAAKDYVEPAKKAVETASALVTETVADAATKIVEGVQEAASDAKDAVKSVFDKIGDGITAAKDAILGKEEKLEDVAIPEGITEMVADETLAEDAFPEDDEPKTKKRKGKK